MRNLRQKVALLWRGDRRGPGANDRNATRLRPVFDSLANMQIRAEYALYSDEQVAEVREELLRCDGVLVWVDPISDEGDRVILDSLLREIAACGVWVSSHPDVILKMGVK